MFNDEDFLREVKALIDPLCIASALEVGAHSGEMMELFTCPTVGIDTSPKSLAVIEASLETYTTNEKYEMVYSSGVLEHYPLQYANKMLRLMKKLSRKYVLSIVPNSGCLAYMEYKKNTDAEWRDEDDYTQNKLEALHISAGLKTVSCGYLGYEWAKRFGDTKGEPYLVYCLSKIK